MIPSNVDSRRPEKVQRYKPSQTNGNAPGDDLTPDYMNILGPESTTANAEVAAEISEERRPIQELENNPAAPISVIPTSSQYGIASLLPTSTASNDIASESATPSTDTLTETTAKSIPEGDGKDMHSTPSRNDRFKVVKIASLEPFRRGRWKCMDYVDQTTPVTTTSAKVTQAAGNLPIYMHTQSLPQQHFQQMLVQGGYNNPQFYQNIPSQMIPQNQYFYPTQAVPNMQTQTLPQQQIGVTPNNVQPVYISTTQPYMQPNVVPNSIGFSVQGYPNVQYVPSNLIQNQGSAFIPTSQNVNNPQIPPNFQQSQTYAGQPNVSQPSVVQPMVNGHAFPPSQNDQVPSSLPTQAAKNAILNSQGQIQNNQSPAQIQAVPVQAVLPNQQYTQPIQPNTNYQQIPVTNVNQIPTSNPIQTTVPLTTIATTVNLIPTSVGSGNPNVQSVSHMIPILQQCYDPMIPTSIYANPQFVANINNVPPEKSSESQSENSQEIPIAVDVPSDNLGSEDSTKANPVVPQVNAIDNKIEQAMDLVKSHLMYTVREEVEILKEKITELMEKIQQLETENNYLKTQIPKNQNLNPNGTPDPPQ